ncbi:hypothetical protein [Amycolatopsis sp. NPDC051071]|uniref:hypothetical protein n=1 Tax=Amycolatopsis sp. NPDC051071 TaxID=3154637 RepID=UPI00343A6DD2
MTIRVRPMCPVPAARRRRTGHIGVFVAVNQGGAWSLGTSETLRGLAVTYGVLALVHLYLAVETGATWSAALAVAYLCVAAGCVKSGR